MVLILLLMEMPQRHATGDSGEKADLSLNPSFDGNASTASPSFFGKNA